MFKHMSRGANGRIMILTSILLCLAAYAKGEIGLEGYPVWDSMGVTHGGGGGGAAFQVQPAAKVVVQGGKGGFVHGGGMVATGMKGGAVVGHNAGWGAAGGAKWGVGGGHKQVVYPAPKKGVGAGVVSVGGAGWGASKKVIGAGVVSTGGAGWGVGGGHKQVVYPASKKVGAGLVSTGGAGWGVSGGLKKVAGAGSAGWGVGGAHKVVSAGGFGGVSGHKKVVGTRVAGWGIAGGKNAVYPAPQKKVFASTGTAYPAPQKKVVVGTGGNYPHGNVQAVGGHGYFPDVAPGLNGYGKGVHYRQVANVGPMALSCPYGWQMYHGSCYYFSRDRLSWWQAYAKCSFMGGYLAMVNYAHENSFLKLMSKKMKFEDGAWFGLNDILFPKTHTWYWGFGKKGCKWFDWFGKGPKYRGGDNNCVCFQEDYHYQWGVNSCQKKMYYICELNPKMPCKCGY